MPKKTGKFRWRFHCGTRTAGPEGGASFPSNLLRSYVDNIADLSTAADRILDLPLELAINTYALKGEDERRRGTNNLGRRA